MRNPDWVPPKSPGELLQERYWPDEWKILVCCILLNRTKRAQVEQVIDKFFAMWPTPTAMINSIAADVAVVLKPLGFQNRRTKALIRFSSDFVAKQWSDPRQLYGVGEYAARGWEIFCGGKIGDEPPNDHALRYYWEFLHGQ